ncbi:gluconate 2-dehydrogenase subunit 3 family protein [Nocardioides mesophilus]|uniref:Gluconate 2-dehydrogenase subunit 3 family protein n=1 Tax=Nocardioides mesophilus TaxID=433659 RepID=A0A7G9R8H3_9ACTN|nr:gluconate 2-dehydrogenase subunit 3 family protein [Nocardioides mesophilus]QNN51898.1 gluconate 2-dehydrogenase subunit 3 family protein [Nocardioides mesophilus]
MSGGDRQSGVVPGGEPSRFPGFDVLDQAPAWDRVTTGVVLARLGPMPPLRHFTPEQEAVARPLLDLILDQHDEPRVPVFEMIDQRLAELSTDGWRYEDLPPDPEAWSASVEALDADARTTTGRGYADCTHEEQQRLLQSVLDRSDQPWHGMRADRVWSLWSRYACTAFYSHPWAWNEIGFSGPAYPAATRTAGSAAASRSRPR